MFNVLLPAVLSLSTAGCTTAVVEDTGDPTSTWTPPGTLSIWPNGIDFGTVILGDQASELVSLTNEGEGDLEIYDVSFDDDNQRAHWSIEGETSGVISPTNSIELAVVLLPQDTSDPAVRLVVLSDDPDARESSVSLTATVEGESDIRIDPDNGINMGTVTVGESDTFSVLIANDGTGDLMIESALFSEDSDSLTLEIDPTGTSLSPNSESGLALIRFAPKEAGTTTDTLVIACNDPNQGTVELTVAGVAED